MVLQVVSGGQTGVDRAALDAATERGLPVGGWCPRERRAEDGPIHADYPLVETSSPSYTVRTLFNVQDSDGTLILHRGTVSGGTALTREFAARSGRPCLLVDLRSPLSPREAAAWVQDSAIRSLNVAGPRESESPGIYERARSYLVQFLGACCQEPGRRAADPQ